MITLFSTPKPFVGHFGVIQSNAIESWTCLDPRAEVILFGEEPGTADVCERLHQRHVPSVARNEWGTPLLSDMFLRVQEIASHDVVCYANADIIFLSDLVEAVQRVASWRDRFLMVGRRCDVDLAEPIAFHSPSWEKALRALAESTGKHRPPEWIDYFVFRRGTFPEILPFAVGRPTWDNWMLWNARSRGIAVVDATKQVLAIHQNHDYSHHSGGKSGVWSGVEAEQNSLLAGSASRLFTIADSNYHLTAAGMKRNISPAYLKRRLEIGRRRIIEWTRPLRHRLGLRRRPRSASTGANP